MRITALHTYPVKGCHRLDHDESQVDRCGLAGDRRWMVIDADGVGVTQRTAAQLVALRARPRPGGLALRAGPGAVDVVEPVDGPQVLVRVFTSHPAVPARLAADDAHAWLSALLDRPVRLAWLADLAARPIKDAARSDDRVSFADGYPILLTNTASLASLNDRIQEAGDEPVPMNRFRPNLVVDGAAAWAEDDWAGRRLRIGATVLRAAGPCDRCVVTTVDQDTAESGRQPLTALGQHRRYPAGLLFGLNLVPDPTAGGSPVIRVGDPVELLP